MEGKKAAVLTIEQARIWFLRAVACFLLALALGYWVMLVGASGDVRFDTMTPFWRLAATILAVAMPVAALGLWTGGSWGAVLWLPIIAGEFAMYVLMDEHYGAARIRIAIHSACILLYLALLVAQKVQSRQRKR